MKISSELFGNYLKCRYKAHLKASGLAGQPGDYDQLKERLAKQHKERGFLNGFYEYDFRDESQRMMVNHSVFKEGKSLIVKAVIMAEEVEAECDVLQRVDEESSLGDFCYFPVLFRVAERISKHDKLMLGFTGMALAALQGKPVEYGNIIYGKNYKTCRVNLSRDIAKVKDLFDSIKQVASTEQASQMMLNNHCRICEYRDHCLAQAKEKDHLSLISGMSVKEITRLNNKGTFTVTQYAYTFRARRTKTKSKDKFRRFDLQALAIRDKKIYVLQTPKMPESKTSIYVDIEGDPDRNFYYLIGMLVVRDSTMVHHFFWADTENEELDIAARFVEQLHTCDEYSLFHYGAYETKFLKRMKERLNGVHKGVIDQATARAFNVLDSIYSTVYFPTYSNGLKEIGRYLSCNWTDENASGLQSIVWRHEWETHKDDGLKTQLIRYNCEDCLALEKVVGFLSKLQHTDKNEDQTNPTLLTLLVSLHLIPTRNSGRLTFVFPQWTTSIGARILITSTTRCL